MNDTIKTILLMLLGSGLTFLATWFWVGKAAKAKQSQRTTELERQMAVLMAEAEPIHAIVQAMAIAKLTHFHTPKTDKLLEKVGSEEKMSEGDVQKLADALKEREVAVDSEVDEEERIYARILPDLVRLKQINADRLKTGEVPVEVLKVIVPSLAKK